MRYLLSCKSAPIASLCDSGQVKVGRGALRRGGNNVDDRQARRFCLARNARHAQGKIVVQAGCAEQARGGPAGPPCRSQDSQKQGRHGTDVAEGHHGWLVHRHDGAMVGFTVAWAYRVLRPISATGRRWSGNDKTAVPHGKAGGPLPRSERVVIGTPLQPGSGMKQAAATCLGAPRRTRRPHTRFAGRA